MYDILEDNHHQVFLLSSIKNSLKKIIKPIRNIRIIHLKICIIYHSNIICL